MADTHNYGPVNKQVNNPIIQGDFVMHAEKPVKRFLTKIPALENKIIGREDAIQQLHATLQSSSQVVLVNGMGGIGKTTTAMAYAERYREEYTHLVWIEQLQDFAGDLVTDQVLLENLEIEPSDDVLTTAQRVLNRLANLSGKSLLIIDNADEAVTKLKDYLPKGPNWHVLITSRQELAFTKMITLDFLSLEAAKELFYEHYRWDRADETLEHILTTIDYHTLTTELLAKTAQRRRIKKITALKDLLEERGLQLGRPLNFAVGHSRNTNIEYLFPYLRAIFRLDGSISDQERTVLTYFTALPPTFVTFETLTDLFAIHTESALDAFTSNLENIKQKGQLIYDEEQDAYKMHRIIRDVLKDLLSPNLDDLDTYLERIAERMSVDNYTSRVTASLWLPYAASLAQVLFNVENERVANMLNDIALTYSELGQYQQALDYEQRVIAIREAVLEPNHPDIASAYNDIAIIYRGLNQYQQALMWNEKAIAIKEAELNPDHLDLAKAYHGIANTYRQLGQHQQALKMNQKAITIFEEIYESNHPILALAFNSIALTLRELGEYQQALKMHQRAITISETVLKDNHPNLALSYNNIANTYRAMDKYSQALEMHKIAINIYEDVLENNHPNLAIAYSSIAETYRQLKQDKNAEIYQAKADQIWGK